LRTFLRWCFRIVALILVASVLLGLLGLAVYWTLWRNPPRIENLDERLPLIFHFERLWVVWAWVVGLLACGVASGYGAIRRLRSRRALGGGPGPDPWVGRVPELDGAWKEIEIRSGPGFADTLYLMLTPSEDDADALLDASEVHVESRIPRAPSLLRASVTAGGTFLACVARPSPAEVDPGVPPSGVEYACRRLRSGPSGGNGLRGIIVIFPAAWLNRPDAPRLATAYRDDLRAIADILDLRCPAYAVVGSMEDVPGFLDFARRMHESFRTRRRCGFALPSGAGAAGGLVHGGLVWLSGWYETWMLDLMANEPLDLRGNNALFTLGTHIRRFRRRLPELLGATFAAPQGAEIPPLCGCYFAATGPDPETRACAVGIIRGRVLGDPAPTQWTRGAIERDRADRRMAWTVGLIGGSAALLVWAYIVFGLRSLHWIGWAAPAALALAWVIALLRVR
jgi:IcmF-related N-terminal domain